MYLIIISIVVVLILWSFVSNKGDQLFEQQQKGGSGQQQKGGSGQQQITRKVVAPSTRKVVAPSTRKVVAPSTRKVIPNTKKVSGSSTKKISGRENITTTSVAPTKELLAKALAAYIKHNKSGQVDPKSVYKDLVANKYLYFKDGKWHANPNPTGQPQVGSGGFIKGSGGSTQKPGGSSHSGILPKPKKDGYGNEAYGDQGYAGVLTEKQYAQQHGYALSDPGNLIGNIRACQKGKWCSLVTSKDAQAIKAINDKIIANGGVPIGYMSATIEGKREDIANLKQGVDYTKKGYTLDGWGEFFPLGKNGKPTAAYVAAMKKRVDLMAQAGYKGIELDNIDLLDNAGRNGKSGAESLGITQQNWNNFITDLSKYAQSKGVVLVQKNAPDTYNPQMTSNFGAMSLETSSINNSSSKINGDTRDIKWDQVKAMSDAGKPILVTQYGLGGCNSIKNYMKTKGINMDNVFVTCQAWKAGQD